LFSFPSSPHNQPPPFARNAFSNNPNSIIIFHGDEGIAAPVWPQRKAGFIVIFHGDEGIAAPVLPQRKANSFFLFTAMRASLPLCGRRERPIPSFFSRR